jgi:5-methyltetrahydrofolate--homocysteine methyltransferase
MDWSNYIVIGENIHCTRIIKSGGARTAKMDGGGEGVCFRFNDQDLLLPVPADWARRSPAYGDGKIQHITLAIHHAMEGSSQNRPLGQAYLRWAAARQIDAGAKFLDVNVDECTADTARRAEVMTWLVKFLGSCFDTPLSIDSSDVGTLRAGLKACRGDIGPAMLNSVSLERLGAADLVCEFSCHAIVSAASPDGVPTGVQGRMANFDKMVGLLDQRKVPRGRMHLDPLVLPISVDSDNGRIFLEATGQVRQRFEGVQPTGGLSNVSFGMPARRLLNIVFARLAAEAGGCGGIIDPVSMPVQAIAELDEKSEPFRLARNVLTGQDPFGAEFIAAFREGRLKE